MIKYRLTELERDALNRVLSVLPTSVSAKLRALGGGGALYSGRLSEIRLRAGDFSLAVFSGKNTPIFVKLTKKDIETTLSNIIGGALYMHKETLSCGFVSMELGIRVGIVGSAEVNDGNRPRVGEPSALIFRLPCLASDIGRELLYYIESEGHIRSALIYSPPSGGKTTAIRSLALAASERGRRRVVVVDERREFSREYFECGSADILYGYKKSAGIEIATRVLNPELIIIDELGSEAEARSVEYAALCGVPIVATAHSGSLEELLARDSVMGLIRKGAFSLLIGIQKIDGEYKLSVKEASGI